MFTGATVRYMGALALLFGGAYVVNGFMPGVGTIFALVILALVFLRTQWAYDTLIRLLKWPVEKVS